MKEKTTAAAVPVCLSFAGVVRVPVALELLLQCNGQPLDKQLNLVWVQLPCLVHKPLQEKYHRCYFSPHISLMFHHIQAASVNKLTLVSECLTYQSGKRKKKDMNNICGKMLVNKK